jgi:hypothetical protein
MPSEPGGHPKPGPEAEVTRVAQHSVSDLWSWTNQHVLLKIDRANMSEFPRKVDQYQHPQEQFFEQLPSLQE